MTTSTTVNVSADAGALLVRRAQLVRDLRRIDSRLDSKDTATSRRGVDLARCQMRTQLEDIEHTMQIGWPYGAWTITSSTPPVTDDPALRPSVLAGSVRRAEVLDVGGVPGFRRPFGSA